MPLTCATSKLEKPAIAASGLSATSWTIWSYNVTTLGEARSMLKGHQFEPAVRSPMQPAQQTYTRLFHRT